MEKMFSLNSGLAFWQEMSQVSMSARHTNRRPRELDLSKLAVGTLISWNVSHRHSCNCKENPQNYENSALFVQSLHYSLFMFPLLCFARLQRPPQLILYQSEN